MRGFVRIGLTVAALGLGLTLAGCEDFDPTAIFDSDIFNTKKPLPGQRHPVFPEGTPGVSQGVPPELVKGYQQPAEAAAAPQTTATATPKQAAAEPSEPKPKLKPKVKPKLVAKPAEQPTQTAGAAPEQATSQSAAAQSQWRDPPHQTGAPPRKHAPPQPSPPHPEWPPPPQQQAPPPAGGWPASPQASGGAA